MNRRDFFKKASIVAAGIVAADQLEILDRLGWTRKLFPSATILEEEAIGPYGIFHYEVGLLVSQEMLEDDIIYEKALVKESMAGFPSIKHKQFLLEESSVT